MDVRFVGFKPNGERVEIPLDKPSVVFGRGAECDVCIPISSVSRQHCEVSVAGDQVWVNDLGSANGTFVNNDKIDETRLTAGDRLVMGPLVLTLQVDGVPGDIEPASVTSTALTEEAIFEERADEDDPLTLAVSDVAEAPAESPLEAIELAGDEDDDGGVFTLADEEEDEPIGLEPAASESDELEDPFAALGIDDDDANQSRDPFADLGLDEADGDDPLNF
jgi:predicted component of type VI protein secretion system